MQKLVWIVLFLYYIYAKPAIMSAYSNLSNSADKNYIGVSF